MLPLLIFIFAILGAFLAYKAMFGFHDDYKARKPKKSISREDAKGLIARLRDPKEDAKLIHNKSKRRRFLKKKRK